DKPKIVQTDRSDQAGERLEALAEQGAWVQLWQAIPRVAYRRLLSPGPALLAALAGCCWLAFLWQAMRLPGGRETRFWCAVVAIPLGMLSIWPTHFLILWQEYVWNLHESPQLIPGLRFFIFGVGLREEVAKLLCLLPLMPLLLRIGDELTALVVSGCVGLGFAVVENASCFAGSGGADVLGRFLTANPAHITLTGLLGLAVYRAARHPQVWGLHALGVFGTLVCVHGLYDAFILVPALREYSMFGTIVFALLVYQFFHELRAMCKPQADTISLTANFLFGVSLLTAAMFVYLSATVGTSIAFDLMAKEVISLAVMVYLFLREMPETMIRV
ncbi:MAG: PrsW family intramembrane metalloprotease, partial [Pirellulales bacterium]|nr:PrsW family intramembrane metalloprotease [Pirellulales bacterium]